MPQQPDYAALAKALGGTVATQPPPASADAMTDQPPDLGSPTGRFASNAWDVLNPMHWIEGLNNMLHDPFGSAVNIGKAQTGQAVQALDLARQGRGSEASGHALASMIPIIGPQAAQAGEQIASGDVAGGLGRGVGLALPAAAPAIVRGGVRVAGGVVPELATKLESGAAARYEDVMAPKVGANKTRFGNRAQEVAPALSQNPEMSAMSREGLHGKVQASLERAKQGLDTATDARLSARTFDTKPIIDDLLKKRAELTAQAVEASDITSRPNGPPTTRTDMGVPGRATGGTAPVSQYSATVQERYPVSGAPTVRTSMGIPGGGQPTTEALTRQPRASGELNPAGDYRPGIGSAATSRTVAAEGQPLGRDVVPGPNAARVAELDRAIAEIKQLGPAARYESLRRIRQAYDGPAKVKYSPSVTADYLKAQGGASGAADVTDVLREHLAQFDPETAKANGEYHLYKTANDVLTATQEVERTRPKVGRQIMARLTGATVGGQAGGVTGAAAGYVLGPVVDAAVSSGLTTQLKTAQLMTKLAGAIRSGDMAGVNAMLSKLRLLKTQAATLTGKATNPSESQKGRGQTLVPQSSQ